MLLDLIELTSDAVFVTNTDGLLTEVNEVACQLLECERQALLNQPIASYLPEEVIAELFVRNDSGQATASKSQETQVRTKIFQLKQPQPMTVEARAKVMPSGHRVVFLQKLSDIAPHQEQEAAQQTLDALMTYIPEGITIADAPDVVIRQVSRYGQELLARPAEVLEGIPAEEHVQVWDIFYADGVTRADSAALPLTRAVQQGEVVTNEEWIMRRSDGEQIVALCNAGPIYDGEGKITGGVIAWRDITERKRIDEKRRQTELALRESESRFRTLADNIAQLAWTAEASGSIFWYNQRWFDYTGTTLEEMQSWGWQKVHHPDYVDRVVAHFRHSIEAGETWEDTFPLRGKDGQYRWFLSRAIPIRDAQGQILQWFGTNTDITDRKQAEIELQQREEMIQQQLSQIEAIYRGAPIGLCFIDTDLRFVRINEQLAQINGVPVANHIGRTMRDILPEQADQLEPLYRQVIASGEPILNLEVHGINLAQPGIERDWLVSYLPQKDAADRVVGVNVMVQEITDRKRAEIALQERSEHNRLLYETTRDLLSTDQPLTLVKTIFAKLQPLIGVDTYFNYVLDEPQQRLYLANFDGIEAECAQAVEWIEIGQPVCGRVAEQRCQLVIGNVQSSTDPLTETVRSVGLAAYSCQPLIAQGKLFGTLGFGSRTRTTFTPAETHLFQAISDQIAIALERAELVSSLQQQTEELRQVNRLKDDFFSALSHELRTPLNPILGWTKLLQTQRVAPNKVGQALDTIERNTRHMVSLIDDLLDIARSIRGKLQLDFHPIDLALALQNAIETVEFAAQAKNITIDYIPSSSIYTFGDSDRLQQVFWNLLSNAIKFTAEGGRVAVKLEQVAGGNGEMGRWGDGEVGSSENKGTINNSSSPHPLIPSSSHPLIPSSPQPHFAQITITDTGIGIDPEFLPHVFEYFRQAEGGSTRSYSGLGLGLAIVRHLVELHGGTITAASPGLGHGASFTVNLPLQRSELNQSTSAIDFAPADFASADFAPGSQPPALTPVQALSANVQSSKLRSYSDPVQALPKIRVMVLDDEPDNLALVQFLLEQEGLIVLPMTSAIEALEAIAQVPPDLLISDIGMAEMDGYELLRRVRAMQPQLEKTIPAIALTAFAQPEDRERAVSSGFQAFIPKPVDPLQVVATIRQLVS